MMFGLVWFGLSAGRITETPPADIPLEPEWAVYVPK